MAVLSALIAAIKAAPALHTEAVKVAFNRVNRPACDIIFYIIHTRIRRGERGKTREIYFYCRIVGGRLQFCSSVLTQPCAAPDLTRVFASARLNHSSVESARAFRWLVNRFALRL
jgi:hypothetical protein